MDISNKTIWFAGEEVKLSGVLRAEYGGLFALGTYLTGPNKGDTAWVSRKVLGMQGIDLPIAGSSRDAWKELRRQHKAFNAGQEHSDDLIPFDDWCGEVIDTPVLGWQLAYQSGEYYLKQLQ